MKSLPLIFRPYFPSFYKIFSQKNFQIDTLKRAKTSMMIATWKNRYKKNIAFKEKLTTIGIPITILMRSGEVTVKAFKHSLFTRLFIQFLCLRTSFC